MKKAIKLIKKTKYSFFIKIKNIFPNLFIKKILITRYEGIGDVIMLLPLIKGLAKKYPSGKIYVETNYPEIFLNNPLVEQAAKKINEKSIDLYLTPISDMRYPLNAHITELFCKEFGVEIPPKKELELFIEAKEEVGLIKRLGLEKRKYIVIQPWPGKWTRNKDWYGERWTQVVQFLNSVDYEVFQIGLEGQELVNGVIDLRNKTTIRESAILIKYSRLLITCNSFSQQLAYAVGTKALILYGCSSPVDSSYPEQDYIFKNIDCSPCWKRAECSDRRCMYYITVENVISKVKEILKTENCYNLK